MAIDFAGIRLKNPVMTASGTFSREYAAYTDVSKLGAVIPKSVGYQARRGNKPPRTAETPAGMLNAIGLENNGVQTFIDDELTFWRAAGATVIVSIAGETVDEFARTAAALSEADGVAAIEVNVSCPNVDRGGVQFGCRPKAAAEVTSAVKNNCGCPVIVKLTPNVTDITMVAMAVEQAGADAVAMINTLKGMAIDIRREAPFLGNQTGGLSGPAIKPVAIRMVYETYEKIGIPIVGVGGIATTEDAIEFMMAGAAAIQIGTASFVEPGAALRIVRGLEEYAEVRGFASISEVTGRAHR